MGFTRESGKSQTNTQGDSQQQVTPQRTPEQQELDRITLAQIKEFDPMQRQLNQNAGSLVNSLLRGEALPGYLGKLPGGISPEVTQDITNKSLNDVNYQLAKSGGGSFLESGASQSIGARTASDIRTQAEQFNLQNLLQLLNLGVGGQAQVQQPIIGSTGQLGQRLAAVTPVSTTGTFGESAYGKTSNNKFGASFLKGLFGPA